MNNYQIRNNYLNESLPLQTRFNILRGDFYRLNKKLDEYDLKKENEIKKISESFNKKIRQIENDNKALIRSYEVKIKALNREITFHNERIKKLEEKNNNLLKGLKHFEYLSFSKEDEIKKKEKEYDEAIKEYEKFIEDLKKEVDELKEKNKKLKASINRDYTNSSIPSSKNENHKKIVSNSRVKTTRNKGGQLGHKGHLRKDIVAASEFHYLIPDEVINNPDDYILLEEKKKVRKLVDIKVDVMCREYILNVYKNIKTGKIVKSSFPTYLNNEINYGEGIKTFLLFLNSYMNVPVKKSELFIKELTDNKISVSAGFISSLNKKFSNLSEDKLNEMKKDLLASSYLHSDATGIRINGNKSNVYVTASKNGVIYSRSLKKGIQGISESILNDYAGTVIHDHDTAYYNEIFSFDNQECLSHILRYLQDSIENETNLTWASLMKEHLQSIIHYVKNNNDFDIDEAINKYDEIIKIGKKEYEDNPPSIYYRDGYTLLKRLERFKDDTLKFLKESDLPYTNNLSERLLRTIKMKYKSTCGFRSNEAVDYFLNTRSFIETTRIKNESIYQSIKDTFALGYQ